MISCNLKTKMCGCGYFTVVKFPCVHALVLLHHIGNTMELDVAALCDPYYLATTGYFFFNSPLVF